MSELTILQTKVRDFVTACELHLKGSVTLNRLEVESAVNDVLTTAKNNLVKTAAMFLTSKDRIKKYLNESPTFGDPDSTTVTFDAYVFSEQELMDFVDMIEATPKFKIIN